MCELHQQMQLYFKKSILPLVPCRFEEPFTDIQLKRKFYKIMPKI